MPYIVIKTKPLVIIYVGSDSLYFMNSQVTDCFLWCKVTDLGAPILWYGKESLYQVEASW